MANILAVDDDGKIHELLSVLLRRKGHRMMAARGSGTANGNNGSASKTTLPSARRSVHLTSIDS